MNIQVSVGLVIQNQKILMAKRHAHQHQGGLWEFPGGKVEEGEQPLCALKRELKEEVDLNVIDAQRLFTIDHVYPDQSVELIIFKIIEFHGHARHREGQQLRWVPVADLPSVALPQANQQIVRYLVEDYCG